jgi:hypothetical protein
MRTHVSLARHMDQVVHSDLHRGSLVVYGLLICDACSLAGCLCTGLRFSHLSSGDSRFIVCNAQCPFLKDGLKWISGFDFGRGHSYRSHNLLAIIRLKSVKTVNDSLPGCWSPYPVLSLPVICLLYFCKYCQYWSPYPRTCNLVARYAAYLGGNPRAATFVGRAWGILPQALAPQTRCTLHPQPRDPARPPGR